MSKKLLIVSNRLPFVISKIDGKLCYKENAGGGLATAVSTVSKNRDSIWIGWPGIASDDLTKKDMKDITRELKKHKCHPVFLTQDQADLYYSGYCNATVWPLFHYFTEMSVFHRRYWRAYEEVNSLFCKEVSRLMLDDSHVWVHDYQLMLLPKMLRDVRKDASIGFFLHIPFPSFEIFRLLPERKEVLEGLLGADLIGFHTYDYVRHFLRSVQRNLAYDNELSSIMVGNRRVQTDAFPIGIEYDKFAKSPSTRKVKKIAKNFDVFQKHQKVILAVDRTDYSKGIPARLDAYELFLEQHPEYHREVVLILLAVPSRGDVEAYQELRQTIEQKVSRINGAYSTVDWSPVTYLHQSMPFDELSALYSKADVMYVTPLRDGMNLVAKEYIASHHKKDGVLVLSEMAGVASELPEALQVNPNNKQEVANALLTALKMPKKEQKERMAAMQQRVSTYTIDRWANDFIGQLEKTTSYTENDQYMTKKEIQNIKKEYANAKNRLILLDYDGTLKSFVPSPDEKKAKPSRRVRSLLKALQEEKQNEVVIISGRPKTALNSFFKNIKLGLVAEHGAWVFKAGNWVKSSLSTSKWKKPYLEVMRQYADRTPGSIVEEKDYSIVWHFRNVSADLAFVRKEELKMELQGSVQFEDIGVFEGHKMLEVKSQSMHKGAIVTELVAEKKWDFILCIGDDYTDEDMFHVLPERAHSIHVGTGETGAKHNIQDVDSVLNLLEGLAKKK